MPTVSQLKKNLTRLAGEFFIASRLSQDGIMVSLQWGTTIGYDILAYDNEGKTYFVEVKTTASYKRRWIVQKKYADMRTDKIPLERRIIAFVDMCDTTSPIFYAIPAKVLISGLKYHYSNNFSNSASYEFALLKRPRNKTKNKSLKTLAEKIDADMYLNTFDHLELKRITR